MLTVLVVLALGVAFANGANDNFKGVATLYGAGALSYRRALAWATVTTAAGSAATEAAFCVSSLRRSLTERTC